MKYTYIVIFLIISLTACTFSSQDALNKKRDECLPGHILISHIGDSDFPITPVFILTKGDTTYLKYQYEDRNNPDFGLLTDGYAYFDKNNFDTIKDDTFLLIKEYIVNHNTHKQNVNIKGKGSFKIFLFDKCDSITYAVEAGKEASLYLPTLIRHYIE